MDKDLHSRNVKSARQHKSPSPDIAKSRSKDTDRDTAAVKRRCVSTACIACRRRKSKCDGNTPSCAACSSVYGTKCVYDPNSDHRRKGVYKKDIDSLKTRNSTLQTLIQAILNYPEDEAVALVKHIRACESLDDVAASIIDKKSFISDDGDDDVVITKSNGAAAVPQFEKQLSGKLGELRLDNGSFSVVGGTSNLIYLDSDIGGFSANDGDEDYPQPDDPITSWTEVTADTKLVVHLLNMYFTWHYTYFTTLSKDLFYRDLMRGYVPGIKRKTEYCTSLLVNAMLALGCHFTSWPAARAKPEDSSTVGDHFFNEAKRLILENNEHESPKLATVQALALMSVREAGCGREARGWAYSGMSFRMAFEIGLNVDSHSTHVDDKEVDARRITIWGCFLFDKCWSNYLGRQPQLPQTSLAVPKFDVFPGEEADTWAPYTDSGVGEANAQASRLRTVALQIMSLCEISNDLMLYFYHPNNLEKPLGRQTELNKLSEMHTRLEAWRKDLPKELEARDGQLPSALVMHMFYHLLFIHLFRPFLRYRQEMSPLPSHVSPRKLCTQAAAGILKLFRIYKRTYGLRQICNITVYICHTACTIHLLNLPDKNASRDFIHGLKHLEEIAESWLCARRTLSMLHTVAKRWNIDLPYEAETLLARTDDKYGPIAQNPHRAKTQSPLAGLAQPTNTHDVQEDSTFEARVRNGSAANAVIPDAKALPTAGMSPPNVPVPLNVRELYPQHLESWQQDQENRNSATQSRLSPRTLFGGVETLLQGNQDYWLREEHNLYDYWNAYSDAVYSRPDSEVTGSNGIYQQQVGNNPGNDNQTYVNSNTYQGNDFYGTNGGAQFISQRTMM